MESNKLESKLGVECWAVLPETGKKYCPKNEHFTKNIICTHRAIYNKEQGMDAYQCHIDLLQLDENMGDESGIVKEITTCNKPISEKYKGSDCQFKMHYDINCTYYDLNTTKCKYRGGNPIVQIMLTLKE